jgi:hypothetical protein
MIGIVLIFCEPLCVEKLDKYLSALINNSFWTRGAGTAVSIGCFFAVLDGYKTMNEELPGESKRYIYCLWALWGAIALLGIVRIEFRVAQIGHTSSLQFVLYAAAALILLLIGLLEKLGCINND